MAPKLWNHPYINNQIKGCGDYKTSQHLKILINPAILQNCLFKGAITMQDKSSL